MYMYVYWFGFGFPGGSDSKASVYNTYVMTQRADRMKTTQKTNQTDHMDHSLV